MITYTVSTNITIMTWKYLKILARLGGNQPVKDRTEELTLRKTTLKSFP